MKQLFNVSGLCACSVLCTCTRPAKCSLGSLSGGQTVKLFSMLQEIHINFYLNSDDVNYRIGMSTYACKIEICNKNAFQWDAYGPLGDRSQHALSSRYPIMHQAGGCLARGVCPGGYLPRGVSAGGGGVCPGGCLHDGCLPGGVCPGGCLPRGCVADTPHPPLWTDRQTPVKS